MKKIIKCFLSIVLVVSLLMPMGTMMLTAVAADNVITISNAKEFNNIRNDLNGNYKLTRNIDLSSFTSWLPIGSDESPFTGSIDGNGYSIYNLQINSSEIASIGLFGSINNATVKKIIIKNANYQVKIGDYDDVKFSYVAGLSGTAYNSTIDCCSFTGTINHSVGNNVYCRTGGITGSAANTTISNCYVNATISGSAKNCNTMVAGFAPWLDNAIIDKCYIAGSLTANNDTSYTYAGGFSASANSASIWGWIYSYGGTVQNSVNLLSKFEVTGSEKYADSIGNYIKSYSNRTISPNSSEATAKNTYSDLGWDFAYTWQIKNELPKFAFDLFANIAALNSKNVVLSYGNLVPITNANVTTSEGITTIEAEGYYTAKFGGMGSLYDSDVMMYAAVPESTNSHISAVHCNGVDALIETDYVQFGVAGDSEEDKNREIKINVYTDLSNPKKFQLLYDGIVLEESENGEFNIKAKDIPGDKNLKVRVVGEDGTRYDKIETNIKVYSTTTQFSLNDNKISVTLPENLPEGLNKIIGGMKFDLDLSSLPFFVLKDKDTIKIGVGASESSKYSSLTSNISDGEDTTSYWDKDGTKRALWVDWKLAIKKAKEEILSNTAAVVMNEKTLDFSTLGCSFAGSELSPVKVNAKAAFYCELKYENGKWTQSGVDGFICISASMSWSSLVFIFYVPVEFKLTGKLGASADVSILYDTENAKMNYEGTIDFTVPSLTGSATIGIPKVFNGGGYVNLTNKLKVTMWDNIKGTLSGDLGVQGQFVVFSGSKTLWKFLDWEYLNMNLTNNSNDNSSGGGGSGSFGEGSGGGIRTIDLSDAYDTSQIFDKTDYFLDSRDYLDNQSKWLGNTVTASKDNKINNSSSSDSDKLLQSSIYQYASPKIVSTDDGTTVMVWTTDIAERSTGNQTAVVYSIYDSENDTWTTPTVIDDDGTADAYPDIATDGENIYVTWVNTNKTFGDDVTIEKFASSCEICVAEYNKELNQFENIKTLTDDDKFDFMPTVYADDGSVYVAYVKNSANEPLTLGGTNTVVVEDITEENTKTVMQTSVDCPVESLDIAKINNKLIAAYTVDTDGNIQTTEDVEICILDETNFVSQYTNNDTYERGLQFASINGDTALSYYADNEIKYTFDLLNENSISIENGVNVSADYMFVNDKDGTVLLTKTNMDSSENTNVYANVFDGENWIGDALITNCEYDLKDFSACKNIDGDILLCYTTAQYEEEIEVDNGDGSSVGTYTETVNMYSSTYSRSGDIELLYVDFNDNSVIPGEELPVSVYVKNNGLKTVDFVTVESSCLNECNSIDFNTEIKPGETLKLETIVSVPESLNGLTDITFSVLCNNDINDDNNEQTVEIGYTDLSVDIESYFSGGVSSALITINNISGISTDAKLLLHKDSYDGDIVEEYSISNLQAKEKKQYYLSSDVLSDNYDYGDTVYVEVVSDKDEKSAGDNTQYFIIDTPDTEDYTYTVLDNDNISITSYNGTETELKIPSTYDDYIVSEIAAKAIPNTVKSIELPATINSISTTSFNNATSLSSITVADGNEYYSSENGVLYSKDKTQLVRCPIAIENKELVVPEGVNEICQYACDSVGLTSISLANSLTTINSYSLSNNDFENVSIPENVTTINKNAFYNCYKLKEVNYNAIEAETGVSSNSLFSLFKYSVFKNCSSLESINIGEKVKSIPTALFTYLTGLKTVNILGDSNLETISKYAFYGSNNLEDVYYSRYYKYWKLIDIASNGNSPLLSATLHCLECENCSWDDGTCTVAATCSATGKELYVCTVCEKERVEILPIDSNNHPETEIRDKKDATCVDTGYTGDTYCTKCDKKLFNGETIAPTGNHDYIGIATVPSCTEKGYTTYTCSVCGDTYVDDYVDSLGHTGGTATCKEQAICTVCGKSYGELNSNNHTNIVTDKAVDATCSKTGLTEGSHCADCNKVIVEQTTTSKLNHTYTAIVTAPTCTEKGYTTYTCTCGDTYVGDYIDALGHTGGTATCKEQAVCTTCGKSYGKLDSNNHTNIVTDKAVDATCSKTGLTEGSHCADCNKVIVAQTATKKLNHTYTSVVTAPTCTEKGYTTYTCTCGDTYVADYVDALGHIDSDNDGKCDICEDELSAVTPTDPTETCSCMCHKSGFSGFIWKILRFFYKLFGTNKTCGCGIAHY